MQIHSMVKRLKALGHVTQAYMLAELSNDLSLHNARIAVIEDQDYSKVGLVSIILDLIEMHRKIRRDLHDEAEMLRNILCDLLAHVPDNGCKPQLEQTA